TAARAFQRRTPIGSSCPSYVCRVQANRPAESALASRSRNGSSKPTTARSGSTARCVRGREWCSLFRSAAMSVNGPHGEPTGERDKVNALDLGADDYITKPFGIDELLARVRVALRHLARPKAGTERRIHSGELVADLERREVTVGDRAVHLTPTEYDLLKVFLTNPNKVLTDRMLLQQVWGPDYGDESHYLHVYVARLRRKIEDDPQE